MPMASSREFYCKLDDIIGEYWGRLTPVEIVGNLTMLAMEVKRVMDEDDDDDGEEWKRSVNASDSPA